MSQEGKKGKQEKEKNDDKVVEPKFGPRPSFPYQKVWSRSILILGVLVVVWYNGRKGKEISLAKQKDTLLGRTQNVQCSEAYTAVLDEYPGCGPAKCGRVVSDKLVSSAETEVLLKIAKKGMSFGNAEGGVAILDLHSGALVKDSKFVNFYSLDGAETIYDSADLAIYRLVTEKIHQAIAQHFGIDASKIYLTKPSFFSRMTNAPAKTLHDEYWLPHVDQVVYKWFHYTSLLYLNDYGRDFEGGRFVFMDPNNVTATIEPRKGRVSMFTSGAENLHAVERVTSGTRYALTISFTCNSDAKNPDPSYAKSMREKQEL